MYSVKSRCMPRPLTAPSAEPIRSRQNARLKDLRQRLLHSSCGADGLIAIEGEHLIEEAIRSGLRIDTLFLREDHGARRDWIVPGNPLTFTVIADVFDHACATESPQGIAALVEAPSWSLEPLLQNTNAVFLVLAGLQDPGNVGTIIRTAEAFGSAGVLLTPGTVNPWNQKVLRASAGSSFRLPVIHLEKEAQLGRLRENGISLYATGVQAEISVFDAKLQTPMAFVIGNEGAGIPKAVFSFCSGTIQIPYPGPVESLNAAIAAAILLYEASRQSRSSSVKTKS